jgi:nicotinamide riboside kinase
MFYSHEMFGKIDVAIAVLAHRPYEHIFLCAPDFDFVQDGTRKDDSFRRYQHDWYLRELNERGCHFTQLKGSIAERLEQIESVLS